MVGWVMCSTCEDWVKLASTPFETVEEAEAAASYRCHKCEALRILREEFALLIKHETEKWHLTVENVKVIYVRRKVTRPPRKGGLCFRNSLKRATCEWH